MRLKLKYVYLAPDIVSFPLYDTVHQLKIRPFDGISPALCSLTTNWAIRTCHVGQQQTKDVGLVAGIRTGGSASSEGDLHRLAGARESRESASSQSDVC